MSIASKTEGVARLRRKRVLIANATAALIVLLVMPASASGLRSTSERQAASDQARISALAPAHTERVPETLLSSRAVRLQRIVRGLVVAGAPGALAVVRTPSGIRR